MDTGNIGSTRICNGHGSSMSMQGFSTGLDPTEPCVILLFKGFLLDTPAKFAAGVIATFLFCVLFQFIVFLRKKHVVVKRSASMWNMRDRVIHLILVMLQITFGYFVMLVAMTFSAILFVAIILGLVTGHGIFNMPSRGMKMDMGGDTCCHLMDDDIVLSPKYVVEQRDSDYTQ